MATAVSDSGRTGGSCGQAGAHTRETLLPWFFVKSVPKIGNLLFARLIERFGEPRRIMEATDKELLSVEGVGPEVVKALARHRLPEEVARDLDKVLEQNLTVITLRDAAYPFLLRHIPDPPPFLYVKGHLDGRSTNVAVVGSRNATTYGVQVCLDLCRQLAAAGVTVVSGLARGIDTAAHQGAVSGKGKTVAVLGSGLGVVYPPENKALFDRIVETGAVVSELPVNARPAAHHFPARNRIIAGMSAGTLVVEAAKNSGSLITAAFAAEQGREVFAVPGSIRSFKSTGTHRLIKAGALLVENAADIIEAVAPMLEPVGQPGAQPGEAPWAETVPGDLAADEARVFLALGPYPVHIDELCASLDLNAGQCAAILLQLELKGLAVQAPGKLFLRGDRPS